MADENEEDDGAHADVVPKFDGLVDPAEEGPLHQDEEGSIDDEEIDSTEDQPPIEDDDQNNSTGSTHKETRKPSDIQVEIPKEPLSTKELAPPTIITANPTVPGSYNQPNNNDAILSTKPKEKRPKRQYIVKNPNRPKRPLSAYNLFFRHERERLVRESLLEMDADLPNVEEMIKSQERTRTGKRVHRKTHGEIP